MNRYFSMLLVIPGLLFCGCQAGTSGNSGDQIKTLHKQEKFKIAGRKKKEPEKDSLISGFESRLFNAWPQGIYDSVKVSARFRKDSIRIAFQNAGTELQKEQIVNEAGKLLTDLIVYELIPFWYKTRWSFEGHTEVPRQGSVACGYFVSTVLRDAGFNLNRFKLAQGSPSAEAYSIGVLDSVKLLEGLPYSKVLEYFLTRNDGLYFVGLDYHVGFILKYSERLYFIHSNYLDSKCVVVEPAKSSEAFFSYRIYIADITSNKNLIKSWILDSKIEIVDESDL
ncbi:MAG: hypothetical protein GX556_14115 [Fibrobacter sp.]|nr:hypothetical protein [Fibrobacter sp.]